MKPSRKIKNISAGLILILTVLNCAPSAEKKLNKAIELYHKGDTSKALEAIEESLINSITIKKFSESRLIYGENALANRQKNILKIVWPVERDIEISENYTILSYNPDLKRLGLSNGYDIKIYDSAAGLIKTCGPPPDEKRIKIITFINNQILYYKNNTIYSYEIDSDTEKVLSDDKSLTPAPGETYEVKFHKMDNVLAVIAGIAGKYNISVFDLNNNSKIFQNQNIASSKLFLNRDQVFYISGNAGKYSLMEASVASKKTKSLLELDNPTDIEFFSSGILLEDKGGLWEIEYNNNRQIIPFHYELAGQCSGQPVLKYLNIYYLADINKLKEKVSYIKEKIPAIF